MLFQSNEEFWLILISVLIVLVLLFLLFAYGTDVVVKTLKLDRGFESPTIDFGKINDQTIFKLGCIFIGGSLIAHNIGFFLSNIGLLFRQDEMKDLKGEFTRLASSAISLVAGYVLLSQYDTISKLFALNKENTNPEDKDTNATNTAS